MSRNRQTRRDFFKSGSALAAAGLAAPYFFSSTSAAGQQGSDEKLVVASIGVGGRGSQIGGQAARLGRTVACADVHLGNAHRFAKQIEQYAPKVDVYQDYRKVLERPDVQAVTIGTPDHWHVKIAIEAMKAGKDVYCEKPLTLTIQEGDLIKKAVKETGRVFQAGTQQRSEYYAGFLEGVAIARSGRLGKHLRATAFVGPSRTGGPYKTEQSPKELDWDLWLGQAPKVDYCDHRFGPEFRWWIDYSGGDLTDWGVHNVDIALWALGGDQTGILEVEPVEGKCTFPLGREVMCDYVLARARGETPPKDLPNEYNVATNFELNMQVPNGHTIKLITAHSADVYIEGEHGRLAVNRGGIHGKFVATPEGRSPGKGLARRRRREALSRQDRPPHPARRRRPHGQFLRVRQGPVAAHLRRLYPRQHDERPAHVQHRHAAWAGKSNGTRT